MKTKFTMVWYEDYGEDGFSEDREAILEELSDWSGAEWADVVDRAKLKVENIKE